MKPRIAGYFHVMRQRYDLVRDPHSLLLGPEVGREERF